MAQYKYLGRANRGQSVEGLIEAASVDSVASQLVGRGVTPTKIEIVSSSESVIRKLNTFLGADKVNPLELVMFCRQMYTITKSGIPLTRGIRGLSASVRHEHFREVLNDVADRLEGGLELSQAMRFYPKIFDHLFVSMIAVGETSGKLDAVFRQIGFYIERDEETKKRIKSAMRYPSFVMLAIAVAMTIINIFVIPAFAQLFEKFDTELPIVTRILIGFSNLFVNYWPFMLVAIVGALITVIQYMKTEKGGLAWGRYRMMLPVVGGLIDRASMARYSRSFSLMLGAGVPITQALRLCAAAIDNPYLAQKIQTIREGIERGESLLRTHLAAEMFTPLVLQMIAVGEESGQVDVLLIEVAEFYEREVEYDLKTLTDRIEPLLIIVMAIFVLMLALGIFLPMWNLYDVQAG
ncbi:MAG: MSHA biogenesis protein MshG [Flavobacteriales bacterium]|jgi:MSHA biogenesis protein MshG